MGGGGCVGVVVAAVRVGTVMLVGIAGGGIEIAAPTTVGIDRILPSSSAMGTVLREPALVVLAHLWEVKPRYELIACGKCHM